MRNHGDTGSTGRRERCPGEKGMADTGCMSAGMLIAGLILMAGCATMPGYLAEQPAFRSGYAPVNGLNMYYEVYGTASPGKPPLVLLHGGGSTIRTSFGTMLPALAENRQVVALEQQGHGHTADLDRPFSFAQSAEDTVALLKELKIEKADFFGYSNGAHIALEICLRHPEAVHKAVFESMMFSREGSDPAFWEQFNHARLEDMPAELREAYLKSAPRPQDLPVFFAKSVQRMRDFKGWGTEAIKSIKAPSLVIAGDHDVVRPEHAVLMFRLLPDARLAILPDTNHMSIVIKGDVLLPIIEQFLDAPVSQAK